jgi:four helix bundle protein
MAQTFEDLEIWKRACRLAVQTYESLEGSRDYSLNDQMQRSAVSIASNIAEGYERTPKDFIRFLVIAKGSCAELRTQAYIAQRINRIDFTIAQNMIEESKQLSRMIQSLINHRQANLPVKEDAEVYLTQS